MDDFVIRLLDFAGTAIFAMTGAIKGIAHRLDLLGVIVLGCTVGIGGGVFRDTILGMTPAAAFSDSAYVLVCIVTAFSIFLLPRKWLRNNRSILVYADALGLAVFTVIGNAKAMQAGMPGITVVLAGVITATGGGAIRDVLVCTVPQILKYDFYATASLIGGLLYLVLHSLQLSQNMTFAVVSLTVFLLRIIAYHRHLQLPKQGIDFAGIKKEYPHPRH